MKASSISGVILADFRLFLQGLYATVDTTPAKESEIGSKEPKNRQKFTSKAASSWNETVI
jgi:hypothetical protein